MKQLAESILRIDARRARSPATEESLPLAFRNQFTDFAPDEEQKEVRERVLFVTPKHTLPFEYKIVFDENISLAPVWVDAKTLTCLNWMRNDIHRNFVAGSPYAGLAPKP